MNKRFFDLIISLILFVCLLPLLVVISLLIKLSSKGPVLFCQNRVGLHGKDFKIYKFRSMSVIDNNDRFDAGDVSRVTIVGKFIRKTKIDELPQLINVVFGDMSLVGPRPEIRKWVEVFPERWHYIHQVRPGITDLASIIYRNEEEELAQAEDAEKYYMEKILPKKLDIYENYVDNSSVFMDINILLKTLKIILFRKQ